MPTLPLSPAAREAAAAEPIPVLDHGFVRLVDHMGDDTAIVSAARQSYDAADKAGIDPERDARLIHRLMRDRHTSPFEAVEFVFDVAVPIFVERQWRRHRTWRYFSVNELSARYRRLTPEFYVPDPAKVGEPSPADNQARVFTDVERAASVASYEARCRASYREYEWLLDQDWPRELARCVLPLSTYTRLRLKADLHNLLHFLELRLDEHAQWEIRQYAAAILALIEPVVPVSVRAWRERQLNGG